jgi:hypothetical protein
MVEYICPWLRIWFVLNLSLTVAMMTVTMTVTFKSEFYCDRDHFPSGCVAKINIP